MAGQVAQTITLVGSEITSTLKGSARISVSNATVVENNGLYTLKVKSDAFKNMDAAKAKTYNESFSLEIKLANGDIVTISGGKLTITGAAAGEAEISELKNGKPISAHFSGSISIGPRLKDEHGVKKNEIDPSKSSQINVSIGNWNVDRDWILNMSDVTNTGSETTLSLGGLIEWIKDNQDGNTNLSLPGVEGSTDLDAFKIIFNKFIFNITKGTFNIDIQSQKGAKLRLFDKFELNHVGIKMTNMPLVLPSSEAVLTEESE